MNKFFKAILILLVISNSAFASSRVDESINEDARLRLDTIEKTKSELVQYKEVLKTISDKLKKELVVAGKQDIYIHRRDLAFKTFAISTPTFLVASLPLLGARVSGGTMVSNFKSNAYLTLLTGLGLAVVGSPFAVAGMEVGVLINNNDAQKLQNDLINQQKKIDNAQNKLNAEIVQLCKSEENHKLCYSVIQK